MVSESEANLNPHESVDDLHTSRGDVKERIADMHPSGKDENKSISISISISISDDCKKTIDEIGKLLSSI